MSNPWKTGHPQISPKNTYAQAIHNLIHLCDPMQGVAKTWTAQAKNEATWAKLTNIWWESNARPPIKQETLNMEYTIQRYYSDLCWNQDKCKIWTPNHYEIRLLVREAETLAKQTNKTNASRQSTQIWSTAKDELICSLCEKTLTTWTPPRWKCSSYKWTERIYRIRSIDRDVPLMRSGPMAELLTY